MALISRQITWRHFYKKHVCKILGSEAYESSIYYGFKNKILLLIFSCVTWSLKQQILCYWLEQQCKNYKNQVKTNYLKNIHEIYANFMRIFLHAYFNSKLFSGHSLSLTEKGNHLKSSGLIFLSEIISFNLTPQGEIPYSLVCTQV